jgi:hypothetical protein
MPTRLEFSFINIPIMMQLEINRSQTWFKILNTDGSPIDGSNENWHLPSGQSKGKVTDFSGLNSRWILDHGWHTLSKGVKGTWLISDPNLVYNPNQKMRLFIAEILHDPLYEIEKVIWVTKLRLVREATYLDLKRHGIYRAFDQVI